MKIPSLILISTAALSLLQSACTVHSTPQSRIAAYPEYFTKLSQQHKTLVQQNRVTEGMSKDAVYLAWGSPAEVKKSSHKGRLRETWTYLRYEPVYSRGVSLGYGGYGYGGPHSYGRGHHYGGHGGYGGHYGNNFAYNTDVTYLPRLGASVVFKNNRVASWETVR